MLETFICIESYAECNETNPVISLNRLHVDSHLRMKTTPNMRHKMINTHSDSFTELLSSNIILVHVYIIVLLKQCWTCVSRIITKIKKYNV